MKLQKRMPQRDTAQQCPNDRTWKGHIEIFQLMGLPLQIKFVPPYICHTGDIYTVVDVLPLSLLAFGVILLPEKRSYLCLTETKYLSEYLEHYLLHPKPKSAWVLPGRFLLGLIFLLNRICVLHFWFFTCMHISFYIHTWMPKQYSCPVM